MTLTSWQKNAAIVAAAITLVAGVVAGRERPAMDIIQDRAKPAQEDGIDLARLRRTEAAEATVPQSDPFARNFGQQKPAQVANGAEKPSAPPLPFRYFGRLTENGKTEVFVMRGDDLLTIAAGQKIGDYRVEQIADASISFTYLPLKTKQTLDLQ
jgi:Tfp pilus assembly protein PilP